jgi:hypothetical protein
MKRKDDNIKTRGQSMIKKKKHINSGLFLPCRQGLQIHPNLLKFIEIQWDRSGPRLEIGVF